MKKSPIVLVHGMWGRGNVWDAWIPHLTAAGHHVTALTLPGHEPGASDEALRGLGLDDYVEAVTAVVEGLNHPILVGHSMGGLIAQRVASQTSLAALVLVSSAVPAPIFPLRPSGSLGTLRSFSYPLLYWRTLRLLRWEADYLLFNRVPAAQRPAEYAKLIAESGRAAYQLAFGPLNLAGSNRVNAEAITCPILSLAGTADRIVPAAVTRKNAALYGARATYREYPEHAHMMMAEPGGEARVQEIIDWLATLG